MSPASRWLRNMGLVLVAIMFLAFGFIVDCLNAIWDDENDDHP